MAGQGFHIGLAKMITDRAGLLLSNEMLTGVLVMDALNSVAGSRRNTHFTGGAGCVLPEMESLKKLKNLQAWDSGKEKTYITDPEIDSYYFEIASQHLKEGAYKDGMRIHLISDTIYDEYIAKIFDLSKQAEGTVTVRESGETMDGAEFRKNIYALYPMLDKYVMTKAGITARYVESVKEVLAKTMNSAQFEFVSKYLNFNEELEWEDTAIFKKEIIDQMIEEIVAEATEYLQDVYEDTHSTEE